MALSSDTLLEGTGCSILKFVLKKLKWWSEPVRDVLFSGGHGGTRMCSGWLQNLQKFGFTLVSSKGLFLGT